MNKRPLISFIVPAFNEATIVEQNLAELHRYALTLEPAYAFEMLVVNDGSSDKTGMLADAFASQHPAVVVHHHLANRGLSCALQTGFDAARGDIVITLDLDMSYAPYHISLMLRALEETNAAMVLASPYMRGGQVANVPWLRKQLSSWANHYLSLAAGGAIATLTCMVRAYNAAAIRKLALGAPAMDFNYETLFAALRAGMPVVEVPARLEWRRVAATDIPERRSSMRIFSHSWSVMMAGIRHRPSLLFGLPGLIPGILPLVLAILLIARPSQAVVADAVLATVSIQSLSMAFVALLAGSYLRQRRSLSRRHAVLTDSRTESRA
jgi:glycosyltransferase involved in cell wall biosynthesis